MPSLSVRRECYGSESVGCLPQTAEVVVTAWFCRSELRGVSLSIALQVIRAQTQTPADVSTYRPLDLIQVAITRAILPQYGNKQLYPIMPPENERITLDQALKAYTLDSAYVLDLEKKVGSLEVGKLADIVVRGKDLHKIPASDISTTKVNLTMMNGKVTFKAE